MALKLVAPGTRGNKYWVTRGRINGRLYEISLKTLDPKDAARAAKEWEAALRAKNPQPGDRVTFGRASQMYLDYRKPSATDVKRIDALQSVFGTRQLAAIRPADIITYANERLPNASSATKNREIVRPLATVLHHASKMGLTQWLRVPLFREPRPKTRAVTLEVAEQLIQAAGSQPRRMLLTWLFGQGTRISDTLRIQWGDIDLERGVVRVHISKTDTHAEFPLHPDVQTELTLVPEAERVGRLFPWSAKRAVYRWLRRLTAELGIEFTPHMARHSVGTWLNAQGAGLRTIMSALGHADYKSSIRYQTADVELVRAELAKTPLRRNTPTNAIVGENP